MDGEGSCGWWWGRNPGMSYIGLQGVGGPCPVVLCLGHGARREWKQGSWCSGSPSQAASSWCYGWPGRAGPGGAGGEGSVTWWSPQAGSSTGNKLLSWGPACRDSGLENWTWHRNLLCNPHSTGFCTHLCSLRFSTDFEVVVWRQNPGPGLTRQMSSPGGLSFLDVQKHQ